MERQHTENLFRRNKGTFLNIRGVSGTEYKGYVAEVTNDYVLLSDRDSEGNPQTFVLFNAIESVTPAEAP